MPFTACCFSGGLDSVALALVLVGKGHEVEPVYISHRHGGNVTKKEVTAASRLAPKITGRELVVVKAPTKNEKWWASACGQLIHARGLPIPKGRKDTRNLQFLKILRSVGVLDQADHVALGVLGVDGETEFLSEHEAQELARRVSPARLRDVTHEDLEQGAGLEPGQLVTPASLGISGKVGLLKAVGKAKSAREACWSSDSCLMYFNTHCGECASCKGRVQAFVTAWGEDRTKYRPGTFAARFKRRRSR